MAYLPAMNLHFAKEGTLIKSHVFCIVCNFLSNSSTLIKCNLSLNYNLVEFSYHLYSSWIYICQGSNGISVSMLDVKNYFLIVEI